MCSVPCHSFDTDSQTIDATLFKVAKCKRRASLNKYPKEIVVRVAVP
jgi:hypothetical protein